MVTFLKGARILVGNELLAGMALVIEGERIASIVPESELPAGSRIRQLPGGIIAPGFIDVQVNGGGGVLFNQSPTVEAIAAIAAAHRRYGTTGFLPTVISDDLETIGLAVRAVEQAIVQGVPGVLGIHIEGPMLALARKGVHDKASLAVPGEALLDLVCSLPVGRTVLTIAPDVVGPDVIAGLVDRGVIVAAGHTDASFEQMSAGFAAGVTGVTHLFNAMSPLTSRAPGAVGAALDNQTAWCGIIADGVHVHPASLRLALRSRPHDRFMLVTDAMPPVGAHMSEFDLQGRRITVMDDRLLDENGCLAGSRLSMQDAVRNIASFAGLSVPDTLLMASANPAAFLGMSQNRGAIAPGTYADIVWLDDDLLVQATWIGGKQSERFED